MHAVLLEVRPPAAVLSLALMTRESRKTENPTRSYLGRRAPPNSPGKPEPGLSRRLGRAQLEDTPGLPPSMAGAGCSIRSAVFHGTSASRLESISKRAPREPF